jgi:TolB-like protein
MNVLAKQGLKNLQELNLHSTRVGDAGVAQLKDMPIKKLNLSDTIVSDDCIKQLKNMRSLQVLTLDYSDIRNEGAKSFKEMPNLRSLSLKGCPITDDAVMDLSKCQQLMVLNLEDTKLSADKVAFLQKNMPKCVIIPPDGTGNASEGLSNHRQHQHPQERRPGIFRLSAANATAKMQSEPAKIGSTTKAEPRDRGRPARSKNIQRSNKSRHPGGF